MEVRWRRVMYDLIMVGELWLLTWSSWFLWSWQGMHSWQRILVPRLPVATKSSRYPFWAGGVAARRSETVNGGTSANNPPFERPKRTRDGRGFHNGQQEDCQDWVLENRHYRFPAPCADDATPPPVNGKSRTRGSVPGLLRSHGGRRAVPPTCSKLRGRAFPGCQVCGAPRSYFSTKRGPQWSP